MPFKETESKRILNTDQGSIFDDGYQKTSENTSRMNSKFEKNYLKGQMRSNIDFNTPQQVKLNFFMRIFFCKNFFEI